MLTDLQRRVITATFEFMIDAIVEKRDIGLGILGLRAAINEVVYARYRAELHELEGEITVFKAAYNHADLANYLRLGNQAIVGVAAATADEVRVYVTALVERTIQEAEAAPKESSLRAELASSEFIVRELLEKIGTAQAAAEASDEEHCHGGAGARVITSLRGGAAVGGAGGTVLRHNSEGVTHAGAKGYTPHFIGTPYSRDMHRAELNPKRHGSPGDELAFSTGEVNNLLTLFSKLLSESEIILDESSIEWLRYALQTDKPPNIREMALVATHRCREVPVSLAEVVTDLLERDPNDRIRTLAAETLASLPSLRERQKSVLRVKLDDAFKTVTVAAATALHRHGDADARLLMNILGALTYPGLGRPTESGSEFVRASAARALAYFDKDARRDAIQEALMNATRDDFIQVKAAANASLIRLKIRPEEALSRLNDLQKSPFGELVRSDVLALYTEKVLPLVPSIPAAGGAGTMLAAPAPSF